jgi:hypothetical protein
MNGSLWVKKGFRDARNHYVAMRRLQESQLHHDQEQEEAFGARGDPEILQYLPEAHGA